LGEMALFSERPNNTALVASGATRAVSYSYEMVSRR
jgi:hypothetical protein